MGGGHFSRNLMSITGANNMLLDDVVLAMNDDEIIDDDILIMDGVTAGAQETGMGAQNAVDLVQRMIIKDEEYDLTPPSNENDYDDFEVMSQCAQYTRNDIGGMGGMNVDDLTESDNEIANDVDDEFGGITAGRQRSSIDVDLINNGNEIGMYNDPSIEIDDEEQDYYLRNVYTMQ